MDVLNSIMQWIVAPVAGYVWLISLTQQTHATEIVVLKATRCSSNGRLAKARRPTGWPSARKSAPATHARSNPWTA